MTRVFKYDWMRFLGLVLIILAHINSPWLISQIRCFDVPLMVFVSGFCYKPSKKGYANYVWRRFKRLYYPTFIFLIIFFCLIYFVKLLGVRIPYSSSQVIGSFFLLESPSIGYVWIIRVFLITAFIAPLVYSLMNKGTKIFLFLLIAAYFVDLWLIDCSALISNIYIYIFFEEIILYAVGYGIILSASLCYKDLNEKIKLYIAILSLSLIIGTAAVLISTNSVIDLSSFKYPPGSYFIIYGLLCCFIVSWMPLYFRNNTLIHRIIVFESLNSLWIYFWHIPFVVFMNSISTLDDFWYVKWVIALVGASYITMLQVKAVKYLSKKTDYSILKYLK